MVEEGYEFFAKRQLVTVFSAPNYCGEFNNAGAMMNVDQAVRIRSNPLRPAPLVLSQCQRWRGCAWLCTSRGVVALVLVSFCSLHVTLAPFVWVVMGLCYWCAADLLLPSLEASQSRRRAQVKALDGLGPGAMDEQGESIKQRRPVYIRTVQCKQSLQHDPSNRTVGIRDRKNRLRLSCPQEGASGRGHCSWCGQLRPCSTATAPPLQS